MKIGERIEFSFWEAGCLIWVGAKDLCGLPYNEFCNLIWGNETEKIQPFILENLAFLAMNLYQDDGYRVRVVMGELNPQEQEEWVARVRWKLDLSCGAMVVSGILDEDEEEFQNLPSAEEIENGDALQCYVDVPPGIYQVEIYSYAPGDLSTGWGQITNPRLFKPQPGIEPESIKDYFLRTRQPEEMTAWIGYEITEDEKKKSEYYQEAVEENYIDFIIRLSSVIEDLPVPKLEADGGVAWEFRKPHKCPLGIVGMQVK
ncbi:MAG: hypothetical protein EAZ77_11640 [Nostocales cyanobacterium]|nr:MAG: hypothetical protein EAZ77_11640 [Nostocales cyanobacterium]